jgi:hypothetical protein
VIAREFFMAKLKKAGLLAGHPVEIEVAEALYEELGNSDQGDFLKALKDIAYGGERVNLANIFRHLSRHQSVRIEEEARASKRREERELAEMKMDGLPDSAREFLEKY